MGKPPGMTRRGGVWVYWLRVRVPTDLISALKKKEITFSLRTGDRKNAEAKAWTELARVRDGFAAHREGRPRLPAPKKLRALADGEMHDLVQRWFHKMEAKAIGGDAISPLPPRDSAERDNLLSDTLEILGTMQVELSGDNHESDPVWAGKSLDDLLSENGITRELNPEDRERLRVLYLRGLIESQSRSYKRWGGREDVGEPDPYFKNIDSYVPVPPKVVKQMAPTLRELLNQFLREKAPNLRKKTLGQYHAVVGRFEEIIGADTPITEITRQHCREFRDLLAQTPANASKRFRGKTMQQVAILAQKKSWPTLTARSVNKSLETLSSLLTYAADECEFITKNPARKMRLHVNEGKKDRVFDSRQLQALRMPPPFDLRSPVTPASAKQDKIDVRIGGWTLIHPSNVQRMRFLEALGRPPRRVTTAIGSLIVPHLFNRSDLNRAWERSCAVLVGRADSNDVRIAQRTAFSGEMIIGRAYGADEPRMEHSHIGLELSLNPTRYVRYQGYMHDASLPPQEWNLGPPRLDGIRATSMGEMTLDGNDNILGSPYLERRGCPEAWPIHIQRYWSAVTQLFDAVFRGAAANNECEIHHTPQCVMRAVETYWEFQSPDALREVHRLEPHLRAYSATSTTRYFSVRSEQNSLSVQLAIRKGVLMRVYAKTQTRIRFEIIHTLAESSIRPTSGYSGDYSRFRLVLDFCALHAADWINRVFSYLAQYVADQEHHSSYELIYRICQITGPDEAETILSILVNHGRITLRRFDPMRPIVSRLRGSGVIQQVAAYSNTYSVMVEPIIRTAAIRKSTSTNSIIAITP